MFFCPNKKLVPGLLSLCIGICACTARSTNEAGTDNVAKYKAFDLSDTTKVSVGRVSSGIFNLEILSTGKLTALQKADISFANSGFIEKIYVNNGDWVNKGQVLASLDPKAEMKKLLREKARLNRSFTDLDDRLIDYGYRLKDSVRIPKAIMQMAKTKSGFNEAMYTYEDAVESLSKTKIVSPFFGRVANLEASEFNNSANYRKLCTLINDRTMYIEFNILQSEYPHVSKGQRILLTFPGGKDTCAGQVIQTNPAIESNGMIKVQGKVTNPGGVFLDGMNVKVIVEKRVPGQLYVPKTAVIMRDNKEVIFTYNVASKRVKWNYVETSLQNSKFICVTKGLAKGEWVVTGNNTELTNNAEVFIERSMADE